MENDYCSDCFYGVYLPSVKEFCCRYYLMTNERRPCPAGDGCTVKVCVKNRRKYAWNRRKVDRNG